ncbi:MAG TPA: hypothetical protein PK637_17260, partial [Flavobacteriales bacterium]|nr:hypothetical protein [Flavobacteriales bacterium]
EAGWDYLRIYNGNSTAAPALHTGSGFNGASINPTVFTSTAADGSLTFQFTSDGSGTPAGWDATISCILPPTDPSAPVQDPAMPSCIAGTDLSVPGTPPAGDAWYWQTAANGTSTSSPV